MPDSQQNKEPRIAKMEAYQAIYEERMRQINVEGFSKSSDDSQVQGQLGVAGTCYLNKPFFPDSVRTGHRTPSSWPFSESWWKPSTTKRDLEKAGALLTAEKERIERLLTQVINELTAEIQEEIHLENAIYNSKEKMTIYGISANPTTDTTSF